MARPKGSVNKKTKQKNIASDEAGYLRHNLYCLLEKFFVDLNTRTEKLFKDLDKEMQKFDKKLQKKK